MKLKSLLDNMAPDIDVKQQMLACAETKISMEVAAYEMTAKMKSVLNNDQKEQLQNMMMQHSGMMNQQGQGGMMQKRDGVMNHDHDGMMQNQNNQ